MGISPRLVSDFIRPTLLVGLFKPPEELSAAVSMELLYFYALAHQTSFDVRWIRSRSISELIIAPLADALAKYKLEADEAKVEASATAVMEAAKEALAKAEKELEAVEGFSPELQQAAIRAVEEAEEAMAAAAVAGDGTNQALDVRGGSFVQSLDVNDGRVTGLTYTDRSSGEAVTLDGLSGCVLALGSKGMKAVMRGSPALSRCAPELTAAASMDAIDVIAVRLWLDTSVPTRTPANVFSRFPQLRGAGGTFFMLDQLQGDDPSLLWGGDEPQGSVLACDFYNAGALLPLSDEDITSMLIDELLPAAVLRYCCCWRLKRLSTRVKRRP